MFVHGLQGHPRDTWTWESDAERKPSKGRKRTYWGREKETEVSSATAATETKRATVFWPYHLLPRDCPTSRIITWGYDSVVTKFFGGSTNKNDIFGHSRDLLEDLSWERQLCVSS